MKIYLLRQDAGDREDFWPISAHVTLHAAEDAFWDQAIVLLGYTEKDVERNEDDNTLKTSDGQLFIQVIETRD